MGEKTKTMSRENLLQEAEKRAYKYEQECWVCSQCTLLPIQEVFGLTGEDALKAATGFAGGIGRTSSVCGAYLGAVMALGLFCGRDLQTMKHPDRDVRARLTQQIELRIGTLIAKLRSRFMEEYGTSTNVLCDEIQSRIFGRTFDKWNPEDMKEQERLGGHEDKCPMVTGKAARWVGELILKEQAKE